MKKILIKNVSNNKNFNKASNSYKIISLNSIFLTFIILVIFAYYSLSIFKFNIKKACLNQDIRIYNNTNNNETNINLNDEFFQIKSVIEQVKNHNLTYINTVAGGEAKIGNALTMLNNLINICEKIRCKNIITPGGLEVLIKKPIFYKLYNITIFPNSYKDKLTIDINLNHSDLHHFIYRKQTHNMRLSIIRDEIFDNIPRYDANPNDLFIHIRSGDIFINHICKYYSQPPLCFYQKIINNYKYNNIFLLSNGHENPVINQLLKIYPNIKFIKGSIISDIAKIINAYNLVISYSSFIVNLILFNKNLKTLFVYEIYKYFNFKKSNLTMHIMKPSKKYVQIMKWKWKNTKEQLELMINENCSNNILYRFEQ